MSSSLEWCKRCSVVWTAEGFSNAMPLHSPELIYKGTKFYLELIVLPKNYVMVMQDCDFDLLPRKVDVHVENWEGAAVPLSYSNPEPPNPIIWDRMQSDILKAIPDLQTKRRLTFIINFNDDVQLSDQQPNPSIALQTPLYMQNVPCLKSLSEDLSKLLESGLESDVVLTCGDLKVNVHKNLLCTRSEVFAAMLNSDTTESRTGTVDIQDMDEATCDYLVRYLYTGKLPDLTVDAAIGLYKAGDLYSLNCLVRRCASFLEENLSSENVCSILELADIYSEASLKETAINYILQKKIHLQQNDCWMAFCKSHSLLAIKILNRFCQSLK